MAEKGRLVTFSRTCLVYPFWTTLICAINAMYCTYRNTRSVGRIGLLLLTVLLFAGNMAVLLTSLLNSIVWLD